MKKSFPWLLGLLALAMPVFAFAADDATAVIKVISAVFDKTTAMGETSPFADDGKVLFAILASISFSWGGIKLVLDFDGGVNAAVAHLIKTIFMCGLVTFLLGSTVQKPFAQGFDYLATKAAKATGANIDLASPSAAMIQSAGTALESVKVLWDGPQTPANDEAGHSWWQRLSSSDSMLSDLAGMSVEVLCKVGITLALGIGYAIFLVVFLMSVVMISIGLAFAPILLPFLLIEPLAFLGNGCIRFCFVAGFQKVVAAMLFGLSLSLIEALSQVVPVAGQAGFNVIPYIFSLLLVIAAAYMMTQAPSIAQGLISGGAAVGIPRMPRPGGGGNKGGGGGSAPSAPPSPPPGGGGFPPGFRPGK